MTKKIVSLTPIFEADINLWGTTGLDEEVLETIAQAKAILLPQIITPELYAYCRTLNIPVFPNYDWRFRFSGKIGQTLMFKALRLPTPKTICIPKIASLGQHPQTKKLSMPKFPFIVKGNYGHEGQEVFLITEKEHWEEALKYFKMQEREGFFGFILQEYLPAPYELRVIICGTDLIPVWRENSDDFKANLAQGGQLIPCPDKELEAQGLALIRLLIEKTQINLAAVDFLVEDKKLLFNEINYVFGRRALGGSENFYKLWHKAVISFLKHLK